MEAEGIIKTEGGEFASLKTLVFILAMLAVDALSKPETGVTTATRVGDRLSAREPRMARPWHAHSLQNSHGPCLAAQTVHMHAERSTAWSLAPPSHHT